MPRARFPRRGLLLAAACALLLGVLAVTWLYQAPWLRAMRFPRGAEQAITHFVAQPAPTRDDYVALAGYFIEGFVTYADDSHASAQYPGWSSSSSRAEQELEGFARIAPLFGVLLEQGRQTLKLPSGREIDLLQILRSGLLAGTDPQSPDYWGTLRPDHDQRMVEAADIALALWLSRQSLWGKLDAGSRGNIVSWLNQVNVSQPIDNNWRLFVAQVNVVLRALDQPHDESRIADNLARVTTFYRGDGWFTDGPAGNVDSHADWYNAWGFQYHLGWIEVIAPGAAGAMLRESLPRLASDITHLLGPRGVAIFGRSVCYRLAVSAPLIFTERLDLHALPPGQARRALDVTWKYFLERGAARDGRITQGYCGDDAAMLDDYSGGGSCLWSLRSLIVALSLPAEAPFWSLPATPLPVETADFDLALAGGEFQVHGDRASQDIVIRTRDPLPDEATRVQPYTLKDRVIGLIKHETRRPANEEAKYRRTSYGAREPFCGCAVNR